MLKSWLFQYTLLIGLVTTEACAENEADIETERLRSEVARTGHVENETEDLILRRVHHVIVQRISEAISEVRTEADEEGSVLKRVEYVVVEGINEAMNEARSIILERIPEPTPAPAPAPVVLMPRTTPAPRKRQDQGQVNALSDEISRLSSSVSFVSSSLSSSIQGLRQSADDAIRSANQKADQANQSADQANQALQRTISSASSAVAGAQQSANDRASSLSSSFSSQLSLSLSSAQASALRAISVAQNDADVSAQSVMNIAASQIQQARADASGIRGDANNFVAQVQMNSVSAQNLVIILVVSIIGTVILTAVVCWLIVRTRRRKRENRDVTEILDEKVREEPDMGGARFNPYGGGTGYPMDKMELKLPDFGPSASKPAEPLNFGFAMSDFSVRTPASVRSPPVTAKRDTINSDVYGVSPQSFRLQKLPVTQRAEAVKLIRVGSSKKNQAIPSGLSSLPPLTSPDENNNATTENEAPGWRPPSSSRKNSVSVARPSSEFDREPILPRVSGMSMPGTKGPKNGVGLATFPRTNSSGQMPLRPSLPTTP